MSPPVRASGSFLLAAALALLASAPAAFADERVERLPRVHRDWIEKEVVYIITEQEREVFLTLETLEERDRFIEQFWRRRDPNPATPVNEFRQEHYRRYEYANTYLGRDTFRDGWQTDRGRFYILLGEPRDIQRFDGYAELNSAHLWFYQGDPRLGIPSFFYLLFFKRDDFGEYRLYHPVIDGPAALLRGNPTSGPSSDNRAAVQNLRKVAAELANASLSFDPSDPSDLDGARPSLGTDIMISRIEESPKRVIRTDYADAYLRYGNRVSADYSFNYVPSRSAFALLADASGASLVHFSIEIDPENFSIEHDPDEAKYYTTLDISIEARAEDGRLVVATDKEAYIEMSQSQMLELQSRPFAYQDDFPLIPGDFTVSVIVRNRVLRQYTVAESEVSVPSLSADAPTVAGVFLAFDSERRGGVADSKRVATFQVGALRFQPAAGSLFALGETVHLVAQAVAAAPQQRIAFELRDESGVRKRLETGVDEAGMAVDYLALEELVGGNYEVRAALLGPDGAVVSERSTPMVVTPRSGVPRPGYVYRRGLNTSIPGLLDFMLGDQYWSLGDVDAATRLLERAVSSGNPNLVPARWLLANAYLRRDRAAEALELLRPLEESFPTQYEVVAGLGFAQYLAGDYEVAVGYLERARGLRPPDAQLLNALGDCHQRLGDREAAIAAFTDSLALDAEQPRVRERLDRLRAEPPGGNGGESAW